MNVNFGRQGGGGGGASGVALGLGSPSSQKGLQSIKGQVYYVVILNLPYYRC